MFKKEFIDEAKCLYPKWNELHEAIQNGSAIIDRYLCDATPTSIGYKRILEAQSLEEIKQVAMIIKRKNDLYQSYRTGTCYETEDERRNKMGCPRLYAQNNNDNDALNNFFCYGVSYIPDCPKFKTGECWRHFDELGLKMK